jgi:hypothetical protein
MRSAARRGNERRRALVVSECRAGRRRGEAGHHRREEERLREAALELGVEVGGGSARELAQAQASRRREEVAARGIAATLVHAGGSRGWWAEPRLGFRREKGSRGP